MIAIVLVLAACRSATKPDGTGGGSASGPSAATPPATAAPGSAAPPAGTTTPAPGGTQPQRSAADAARFSEVERALEQAITSAKQAKTLKEACSGVAALDEKIGGLHQVPPPPGTERAFSEQRNGLSMKIDVIGDQRCVDGSGADADLIRDELEGLRREFVKLQQMGAKP